MPLGTKWPLAMRLNNDGTGKAGRGRVSLLSGILLATLAAGVLGTVEGQGIEAVAQRSAAATILARASQAVVTAPYAVLSFLEYDDSKEARRQAPILFLDAAREPKRALDEAMLLAPDKPAQIEGFRTRLEDLLEKAPAPLAIGDATPGSTRGYDLTAADIAVSRPARGWPPKPTSSSSRQQDLSEFDQAFFHENSTRAGHTIARRFDAARLSQSALRLSWRRPSWPEPPCLKSAQTE